MTKDSKERRQFEGVWLKGFSATLPLTPVVIVVNKVWTLGLGLLRNNGNLDKIPNFKFGIRIKDI